MRMGRREEGREGGEGGKEGRKMIQLLKMWKNLTSNTKYTYRPAHACQCTLDCTLWSSDVNLYVSTLT